MRLRSHPTVVGLAGLALLASLLVSRQGVAAGLAFVTNSSHATVSVIDVTTCKEVRRISPPREPHHMALTPHGKSLLIGDTTGNALFFLDPITGEVQRL